MTTGCARWFKDLRAYQQAREVSRVGFRISNSIPKEEMYSLTDPLRRAARSGGAQLSEVWGKRRDEKHLASKLTDADSGRLEAQPWLGEGPAAGYRSPAEAGQLNSRLGKAGEG